MNDRRWFWWLLFLVVWWPILSNCGCGSMPELSCDHAFAAGGMVVCSERPTAPGAPAQAEDIVSIIEEEVRIRYPHIINIRNMLERYGTRVYTVSAYFVSGCQELVNSGYYVCERSHEALIENLRNVILLKQRYDGCLEPTLVHEILHSVAYHMIDGNAGHDTPMIFADGTGTSVESTATRRVTQAVLPNCIASNDR